MCRARTDRKGARCARCWAELAAHPQWAVRADLAAEIASAPPGGDVPPDEVWEGLSSDESEEVRLSLIGPATPVEVLALFATDKALSVRDMAVSEIRSRNGGVINLKAG